MEKQFDTVAQFDIDGSVLRDLLDIEVLLIGGGEVVGSGD